MRRAPLFAALVVVWFFKASLPAADSIFSEVMGAKLGGAFVKAAHALEDAAGLAPRLAKLSPGVNPSVLLDEALEVQAELRATLATMDASKAPEGGRAAADVSIAAISSGLAGLGQAVQGMRAGSRALAAAGLAKVDEALNQMKSLKKSLEGESGDEAPVQANFGPSIGLDFSWWTSPVNNSVNFGLNGSIPVLRTWDLGASLRMGSSSIATSGVSTESSYTGFEGFTRVHFPTGRLAPYIGLHLGPTVNTSKSKGSAETKSTLWVFGPQGGLLFFLSENAAIDLQLRYDRMSNSDSSGKEIYAQDQIWLTVGARLMFSGSATKSSAVKKKRERRRTAREAED